LIFLADRVWKFPFFVRDGAVSQKYEEDQNNQAACLHILTNAVLYGIPFTYKRR